MYLNKRVFFSYLDNQKSIENNPHIAVGVSGGPDSMALFYLLNLWVKSKKGKLYALIFNHAIRDNSEEEAVLVKKMLLDFHAKIVVINVKKNSKVKKNMAQARINRFEGLIKFCKKNNILNLFLGHHFDDNLETYLIRKINGSNLQGLESMKDINFFNDLIIFRPLIKTNKKSILNFNKKNKIDFIKDPSNLDINYTRVKVRNFLLNKEYQKLVKEDFLNIKKQIPSYKKMIFELLIKSLYEVKKKSVKVIYNQLIKNDDLIIEKHISIILNFLSNKKIQTKSLKINLFINSVKKDRFKVFNLSGIIIEKQSNKLVFYQK